MSDLSEQLRNLDADYARGFFLPFGLPPLRPLARAALALASLLMDPSWPMRARSSLLFMKA